MSSLLLYHPHKPHTQILSYLVRQKSFPGGGRLGLRLRLRLSPSKGSPSSRTQRVSLPLQARSAHSSCSFTSPLDPLRSRVAPFTFLRTFYYTYLITFSHALTHSLPRTHYVLSTSSHVKN